MKAKMADRYSVGRFRSPSNQIDERIDQSRRQRLVSIAKEKSTKLERRFAATTFTIFLIALSGTLLTSLSSPAEATSSINCHARLHAGVNLAGCYLKGTNMNSVNLSHADLRGSNLTGAELVGANLTDANLAHSLLTLTDLTKAKMNGADLTNVISGSIIGTPNLPSHWKLTVSYTHLRAH